MIPKKIFQTHKNYDLDEQTKGLIKNIMTVNSDFEYQFMDNDECLQFIVDNFDESFVNMYKNLPLDIMRSDVWRVAVIYINGGIYCDTDVLCYKNFYELIKDQEIVIFNESGGGTSNFFFAAKPKHPSLKSVLNLFIKNQSITRDSNSDYMVQNFGMCLFHIVMIETLNKRLLDYHESTEWVNHLCFNRWKKDEEDYKDQSNSNKPITFITTFHKNGYDLYGKVWIESFIKNASKNGNNIHAQIYVEDMPELKVDHPQIKILDFKNEMPNHSIWKENYISTSKHLTHVKNMTVRFSYKGFVIQHALNTINDGYIIWLDGDSIFKNFNYINFPIKFFNNGEVLACQVEDNNHVETGIIIFDSNHKDLNDFTGFYVKNYGLHEILNNYGEPYDGYVFRRSLIHSNVKYFDLNKIYGRGGIQSDPNETFLHPEINSRFKHNIGITGKRSYNDWNKVSKKDNIFRLLENTKQISLNENQKKIINLRNKRF